MLGACRRASYACDMKRMVYLCSIIILAACFIWAAPSFADADTPSSLLRIYAINAGYKDGDSSQKYDFIELEYLGDADLDLAPYRLVYTNSSGNFGGEISFAENLALSSNRLVLGALVNPQFNAIEDDAYVYNFGSAGLASTAGKVELYFGDIVIDEICWGKLECANNYAKFSTKEEDNYSLVRCAEECLGGAPFDMQKYYPEPDFGSITEIANEPSSSEPSMFEPESGPGPSVDESSCEGVIFSEIYSYYINSVTEQFVELYNPTQKDILLDSCLLEYKTTSIVLNGIIAPSGYYVFRDSSLALTKNPTASNTISIRNGQGDIIATVDYPHGQKKGASYAIFDINSNNPSWRQTYAPTPGALNDYQEFQTCPSDKVINPSTGNCIKKQEEATTKCPTGKYLNPLTGRCKSVTSSSSLAACKDGYERNPETNRCRKISTISSTELTPCKDGYERNPETNRCRKIRENIGESVDYAPTPAEDGSSNYQNPKIFTAVAAIAAAALLAATYVIYQYRRELRKALRFVLSKLRRV